MSAFPASRQADASDDSHQRGQRSRPDVGVIGRKEEEGDIVERGGGFQRRQRVTSQGVGTS